MYGQNSGFGTGTNGQSFQSGPYSRQPYGRGFNTERMGDDHEQQQDSDHGQINPTQGSNQQASREPQYNGSYVSIPPNQTKRDKLLTMAKKEEEEYKLFLESRKPGQINLTPQKLGGQTSQEKARQQQQLTHSQSKYQKKFQKDEYKRKQREEEEARIQQMKDKQREKAEKLEEKKRMDDIRRKERWAENMQKKNSEFLDQLSLTTNSSSSDISNGIIHNEWELDEERMLQLVLEESMKTKSEEDERRQKLEKNQPWKERRSDDEALDWAPHNPEWKEYTEYIASQQSYRKQLMEEERRLQNLKGENCRKKLEEEQKRQEMEKTESWQESGLSYQSYKQQLKVEEERKLQQMKEEQRRKSELLEMKKQEEEKERRWSQQEEHRRVNNAFLDKLQRLNNSQHEYSGESNTWA